MRLCVRSTWMFASLASANMLMPMTIAATATTPISENQMRRRMSVGLPLFDDHGVHVQPEADEGDEEDQVAQADDAAGEVLEPVDHRDAAGDLRQHRRVARQEVGDHR